MSGADWIQMEQVLHEQWEAERARIIENVERIPESGCWIWMGHLNEDGYGNIRINGPKEKAHRASYRFFVGDITPGMHVCHTCDVRCCVNPAHLFLGTAADNMQDMLKKHGKRVTRRKLTDEQVRAIRKDRRPIKEVGEQYGIHSSVVSKIRSGSRWGWVQQLEQQLFEENEHERTEKNRPCAVARTLPAAPDQQAVPQHQEGQPEGILQSVRWMAWPAGDRT